jgi:WD40 repeat protein
MRIAAAHKHTYIQKMARQFAKLRDHCRELLLETTDPVTGQVVVRFVHRSMKDWLTGGANGTPDSAFKLGYESLCVSSDGEGHEILGNAIASLMLEQQTESNGVSTSAASMDLAVRFGVRNRFYHLCKALEFERAGDIVFNLDCLLNWLEVSGRGGVSNNCSPTEFVLRDIETRFVRDQTVDKHVAWQAGIVAKVLRLGIVAIDRDSRALAGQIIGRLSVGDVQGDGMERVRQLREQALDFRTVATSQGTYIPFVLPFKYSDEDKAMPSGLIRTLHGHSRVVNAVTLSPNGDTIASASDDHTIRLWDTVSGAPKLHGRVLRGHTGTVLSVAFSPGGRTIASGSSDRTIRLWDAATGQSKMEGRGLVGHASAVTCVAFSPSRKQRTIASGCTSGSIRLWNVATGQPVWRVNKSSKYGHSKHITSLAFSPDGETLVSASLDRTLRLWNVQSGEPKRQSHVLEGHRQAVLSVAYSPDGRTIASGSADDSIRMWDVRSGKCRLVLRGHADMVRSVAFSPDSLTLVSGSRDASIRLWDVDTGEEIIPPKTLRGHSSGVRSVVFSPHRGEIVSGSRDATVRVWEYPHGTFD